MGKRGQMKLSFGMIFSIILIIVFIAFAFFAIKKFVGIGSSAQIGKFKETLQVDVDRLWQGSQGSQEKEYIIPSKIEYMCFIDYASQARGQDLILYDELDQVYYGSENLFFYPIGSAGGLDSTILNHVDLEGMTIDDNPFCFQVVNGKLQLTLKKNFGESLVTITK